MLSRQPLKSCRQPLKIESTIGEATDTLWPRRLGSEIKEHQLCHCSTLCSPMLVWHGKYYQLSVVSSGVFSEEHKIFITTAVEILWQITSDFIIFLVVFQVRRWDLPFQKRKKEKRSLFSKRFLRATLEDYLIISTPDYSMYQIHSEIELGANVTAWRD